MFTLNIFFSVIKGIYQNKSLCRILQNYFAKKDTIAGSIIEFGAEPGSKKNFSYIMKKKLLHKVIFSDKYLTKKGIINADLNRKIPIKKNFFHYVLLFNVLEHLTEVKNAKNQIYKILKKKGILIGSTPFLYRFHGAPSDYLRFSKPFIYYLFHKEFKILKIENLGFGPFTLCYSLISDFTKKIPLLSYIIFTIVFILDYILNKIVKYDLKDIYPIAVYFKVKKK